MSPCPYRSRVLFGIVVLLVAAAPALRAQSGELPPATGSTGFCLFEVPAGNERRQWINLAHVQYVEQRAEEVHIYFGGGSLGSGHEARIPARTPDEAATLLQRLRREAAYCAGK